MTVLEHALNGDAENMDAPARRALYAFASELDEQSAEWDKRIDVVNTKIDQAVEAMKDEMRGVRKLLIGVSTTIIGGIAVGIANILLAF